FHMSHTNTFTFSLSAREYRLKYSLICSFFLLGRIFTTSLRAISVRIQLYFSPPVFPLNSSIPNTSGNCGRVGYAHNANILMTVAGDTLCTAAIFLQLIVLDMELRMDKYTLCVKWQ